VKKILTISLMVAILVSSIAIISCGGSSKPATGSSSDQPVTESSSGTPATMLHSTEGRENCLMCHDEGKAQAFPSDHAGKGNESCLTCHKS